MIYSKRQTIIKCQHTCFLLPSSAKSGSATKSVSRGHTQGQLSQPQATHYTSLAEIFDQRQLTHQGTGCPWNPALEKKQEELPNWVAKKMALL